MARRPLPRILSNGSAQLARSRELARTAADSATDVLHPLITITRGLRRLASAGRRRWVDTPKERRGAVLLAVAAVLMGVVLAPYGPLLAAVALMAAAAWHGRDRTPAAPAGPAPGQLQRLTSLYEALVPYFSASDDPEPLYARGGDWEKVFSEYEFDGDGRLAHLVISYPAYFTDAEPESRARIEQLLGAKCGRGREYHFGWDEEANQLTVRVLAPLPTDIAAQPFVTAPGETVLGFTDPTRVRRTLPLTHGAHRPAERADVDEPRAPLVVVGERPGGVVEVGDDVGDARGGLAQHLAPAVEVPPREPVGHGDGDEPGAGLAHQLEDVGVGGRLHGNALAASAEEMADGVDGAHRAGGDHDLLGHGGDAPPGVAVGDHRAERGQPRRIVAVGVRVRRELLQRALHGAGEPRLGGGQGGAAEVDHGAERLGRQRFQAPCRDRVAGRDGGPASGAAPRLEEALAAQRLVGGGDGRAADGEGEGQFPFGGQPRGDRHAPFEHEQADAVGEGAIGGRSPGAGPRRAVLLGAEQPGQLGGPHRGRPLRHTNQSTFPGLALDGRTSHAPG
ncbi:hypothetical protein SALBM217S_02214 [Streptomyces griseoloalbus]